jgi:hypothetical protein
VPSIENNIIFIFRRNIHLSSDSALTSGVNSSYTEIIRPDISLNIKNKIGLARLNTEPAAQGEHHDESSRQKSC